MVKNQENNGMEEIGLIPPTPTPPITNPPPHTHIQKKKHPNIPHPTSATTSTPPHGFLKILL